MNDLEFFHYHNYHCRFTLQDGSTITGVAFKFSFDKQLAKDYYFVKSNDLLDFRDAQLIGDMERCRNLARILPLSSVKIAERIY